MMSRSLVWGIAASLLFAGAEPSHAQMALPGSLDVSPTGAAVYTIPIEVPPGTAGMAPKLSLQYSSQGGNGLLGMGWSLSGLPAITRCPQTIAQDGAMGGINYDANDRFCFEGERLIAISGTYGADATEYRLEREGFSKVISHGSAGTGPAWFEVRTKSGQVMEFGNTADSRIEAQGIATARLWMVNKVSDTAGNYWTTTYTEDNANGQYQPARIDYTGNSNAGTAPYASIRFVYETRPDIVPMYQAGSLMRTTQRLTNVQTYLGESLVRDYRAGYNISPSTKRSRLAWVTPCDATGVAMPGTTFIGWQEGATNFVFASTLVNADVSDSVISDSASQPHVFIADHNGDGRSDLIMRLDGENYFKVYHSAGLEFEFSGSIGGSGGNYASDVSTSRHYFMMDVNGDGLDDLVIRTPDGVVSTLLSNGVNFVFAGTQSIGFSDSLASESSTSPRYFVMDVNGDGKEDLVMRSPDGSFQILQWNGTSLAYAGTLTGTGMSDALKSEASSSQHYFIMDNNGDGRSDLVVRNPNGSYPSNFQVYQSTGVGFSLSGQIGSDLGDTLPSEASTSRRFFVMDINGDGRADLVARTPDGSFLSYISNGVNFVFGGIYANSEFTDALASEASTSQRYFVMDVNGDGKQDLVARSPNGDFQVLLSDGMKLIYSGTYAGAGFNDQLASEASTSQRYLVMDVNGDGMQDLVLRSPDGNFQILISMGSNFWFGGTYAGTGFHDGLASEASTSKRYFVADVNGDGKQDLLLRSPNGNFQVLLADGDRPDLLTGVGAGSGSETYIRYKSIAAAGAPYTKDGGTNAASFPTVDVQSPVYVVSEVDADNGAGGTYRTTYRYAGAKVHVQGRGFLGFRQMTVRDEQTGIEQTTTYRQDFPFTGLVASQIKVATPSGLELNHLDNTYGSTSLGGTRSVVFLNQSVQSSHDLDGTALPATRTSYTYDDYGNATQVTVETGTLAGSTFTGDGTSKVTTNTYQLPDTTKWILGRLTRAQVTSTTP